MPFEFWTFWPTPTAWSWFRSYDLCWLKYPFTSLLLIRDFRWSPTFGRRVYLTWFQLSVASAAMEKTRTFCHVISVANPHLFVSTALLFKVQLFFSTSRHFVMINNSARKGLFKHLNSTKLSASPFWLRLA